MLSILSRIQTTLTLWISPVALVQAEYTVQGRDKVVLQRAGIALIGKYLADTRRLGKTNENALFAVEFSQFDHPNRPL